MYSLLCPSPVNRATDDKARFTSRWQQRPAAQPKLMQHFKLLIFITKAHRNSQSASARRRSELSLMTLRVVKRYVAPPLGTFRQRFSVVYLVS